MRNPFKKRKEKTKIDERIEKYATRPLGKLPKKPRRRWWSLRWKKKE